MPPKLRSTWEVQATIPVLYTHQKVAKRPIHKEGSVRLHGGRAVLCDANCKRLDEETVTKALLEQLKAGEELDFPGHLLSPDPPDAGRRALAHLPSSLLAPSPASLSASMPPASAPSLVRGVEPRVASKDVGVVSQKFKRPRILQVPFTAASEVQAPEPMIEEREETSQGSGERIQEQATPQKRTSDLRGAGTRFKAPRPNSSACDLGFAVPTEGQKHAEPAPQAPAPVPPGERYAEAALELCRQAFLTERGHLERYEASLKEKESDRHGEVPKEFVEDMKANGDDSAAEVAAAFQPGSDNAQTEASPWERDPSATEAPEQQEMVPSQQEAPVPFQQPPCDLAAHAEAFAWEQSNLKKDVTPAVTPEVPFAFQQPCDMAAVHAEALAWEQKQQKESMPSSTQQEAPVPFQQPPCNLAAHAEAFAWEQSNLKKDVTPAMTPEVPFAFQQPCDMAAVHAEALAWEQKQLKENMPPSTQQEAPVPFQQPPCNLAAHAEAFAWQQCNSKKDVTPAMTPEVPFAFQQPCDMAAVHAEALAWEQNLRKASGEEVSDSEAVTVAAFAGVVQDDLGQTTGVAMDAQKDSGASEDDASEDDGEDDLPLSEVASKVSQQKAPAKRRSRRSSQGPASATSMPVASMRLPLTFGKCHVENQRIDVPLNTKAAYLEYFEQALISEMQHRLSSWASTGRCGLTVRVEELLLGPSKDDPALATMLFGRSKQVEGDLSSCAKNDLWVVRRAAGPVAVGEALLFRSLWKGVTPKGRLLLAPINAAAVHWLQQCNRQLRSVTAICSNAFSSELLQVDTLRQWAQVPRSEDGDRCAQLLGLEAARGESCAVEEAEVPVAAPVMPMDLSDEQREVLKEVASMAGDQSSRCLHVHGVFGSGKSRTLAAAILMLHRQLEARKDPRRILLLCQTNVAVDGVLKLLLQQGFEDFVRLGSFQTMHPAVLHRGVAAGTTRKAMLKDLKEVLQRLEQAGDAVISREKVLALQSSFAAGELPARSLSSWRRSGRLLATTSAALEVAELGATRPFLCFVDEASQLTEPAILQAFRKVSAQGAVLLGDPKQLPPRATHLPLQRSALLRDGLATKTLTLRTQYRCHPFIGNLCSRLFYENQLINGITEQERSSALGPGVSPLAVVLSQGLESRVGQSYRHDSEAKLCAAWLHRSQQQSLLEPKDFGVICLYRPHAEACAAAAAAGGVKGVDFATVDSFQGGEREVVALCCGRSTPSQLDGGFLCPKRLNVAMSRARRHLVIFGTECFLSTHPIFSQILQTAAQNGCVHHASEV